MRTTGNLAGVEFIDAPYNLHHETREQWRVIISESGYFFTKSAMRFFSSRVLWDTLTKIDETTFGFVTSEKCDMPYHTREPRLYTVRLWNMENGVMQGSEFQEFTTATQARHFLTRGGIVERMAN